MGKSRQKIWGVQSSSFQIPSIMYLCYQHFQNLYLLQMGISSSQERKAFLQAQNIRNDLYSRVQTLTFKYKNQFQQIETKKKKKIIVASASELVRMLDSSETTSYEIVLCFIERASTVGIENNYVLDQLFQEALYQSKQCDAQRQKYPNKKSSNYQIQKAESFPPFFGVPISVKETFLMKGRQTYGGFVSKINPIPKQESCFMQLIKKMGFIPFVRTNVPQACKTIETNNHMFGYAKNPWNTERSTGGSSGGEGGLIGSHSSPIGLGSDIGGSLRIPAQFNGLCTLKPGQRSITRLGNAYYGRYSGGVTIKSQLGAITRSVQDLIAYNKFMFDPQNFKDIQSHKLDPYLTLTPLNMRIFAEKPKLKIGVVKRLETVRPSKTHERALDKCAQILKNDDHQVVEAKLPNFEKLFFFMVQMMTSDQNFGIISEIRQSQAVVKEYRGFLFLNKIPWIIKKIIIYFIKKNQPRLAKMIELSRPLKMKQLFQLIYDHQVTLSRQIYNIFCSNKYDAVMMPVFATPAPKLGQIVKIQYTSCLSSSWNPIEYPAGNIPVTVVKNDETDFTDEYEDFYTKNIRKIMKQAEGLPVGVQIVSTPRNEEKVLYLMKELQEKIKFRENYVCPLIK